MKANTKKRLQRLSTTMVLIAALWLIIYYQLPKVIIFYWSIMIFMTLNYWVYLAKENIRYIFLPFFLMGVFMLLGITSLIGNIFRFSVFSGYWATIFAWPSLIAALALSIYGLFILDRGVRTEFKKKFASFFSLSRLVGEKRKKGSPVNSL